MPRQRLVDGQQARQKQQADHHVINKRNAQRAHAGLNSALEHHAAEGKSDGPHQGLEKKIAVGHAGVHLPDEFMAQCGFERFLPPDKTGFAQTQGLHGQVG